MKISNLIGSFGQFVLDNLVYIIVGAMILAFAIIVIVATKKRKKPSTYVPDDIDRTVDEAAEKAAKRKRQMEEQVASAEQPQSEIQPEVQPESQPEVQPEVQPEPQSEVQPEPQSEVQPEPQEQTTTQTVQEALQTEDASEELTFEAADVEDSTEEQTPSEGQAATEGQKAEHTPTRRRTVSYRILYDRDTKTWEVRKDNAKRVIRRVKTKREALEIAQELCQKQDLNLVVHKKDGKFQKKR